MITKRDNQIKVNCFYNKTCVLLAVYYEKWIQNSIVQTWCTVTINCINEENQAFTFTIQIRAVCACRKDGVNFQV